MVEPRRSFLKWAGSKYNALADLERAFAPYSGLPGGQRPSRLVEPFAGSATVSLNFLFDEHLLADGNPDIVNLYRRLCRAGHGFIGDCEAEFRGDGANTADGFYARRAEFNALRETIRPILDGDEEAEARSATDLTRRAVLFVYLNRHCFNGLCRYNSKGEFNVPFGKYRAPLFPRAAMIDFVGFAATRRVTFVCADFRAILNPDPLLGKVWLRPGDLVYADPPYAPLEDAATFTSYIEGGFGPAEQEALAGAARLWSSCGVPVLISNHDTRATRSWYAGARIHSFDVARTISSDGTGRKPVRELIADFQPSLRSNAA